MKTHMLMGAVAPALLLAACGSSNLVVLDPVRAPVKTDTVSLVYENSTVGVPEDAVAHTKQYMHEAFFTDDDAPFHEGMNGVSIHYGFIGYKNGSRIGRYFLGGLGNGDANMVLRAEFYGPNGEKLGEAQSTGKIGGGFLGGSSNSAIKKAVKEIENYAAATFR
jgi:hypothetical protein